MKKAVFILVIGLLALTLWSQTGFFDLSFGDSYDTCDANLYDYDFEYVGLFNGEHIYYPFEDSDYEFTVDEVKLFFENGLDELTGWSIMYYPSSSDDIEIEVIDGLKGLHGDNCVYHEKGEYYSWEFENHRFVEAGFTSDRSRLYVEYGTEFGREEE